MLKLLGIIFRTLSAARTRQALAVENLALRQQLAVLKDSHPRPRLTTADRWFWVVLSRIWSGWREALHMVQPGAIIRWHRQGFRYYWRWKSRRLGRPNIDPEIQNLIRHMCRANPLWVPLGSMANCSSSGSRSPRPQSPNTWSDAAGHRLRRGEPFSRITRKNSSRWICSRCQRRRLGLGSV